MTDPAASNTRVPETLLWFGLLGSPIAWFLHLALVYTVSEMACVAGFPGFTVFGLHGGVSLILGLTALTMALAAAAGFVAYSHERQLGAGTEQKPPTNRGVDADVLRWGRQLSAVFVFIIAVETVPVFFYLQPCS